MAFATQGAATVLAACCQASVIDRNYLLGHSMFRSQGLTRFSQASHTLDLNVSKAHLA